MTGTGQSPFAPVEPRKGPFRFTLGTMLLVMVVFAIMSAALFYATRVPAISREINAIFGNSDSTNSDGSDRQAQLIFVMFCYSAPLFTAGLLGMGFNLSTKYRQWQAHRSSVLEQTSDAEQPWDADLSDATQESDPIDPRFRISKP